MYCRLNLLLEKELSKLYFIWIYMKHIPKPFKIKILTSKNLLIMNQMRFLMSKDYMRHLGQKLSQLLIFLVGVIQFTRNLINFGRLNVLICNNKFCLEEGLKSVTNKKFKKYRGLIFKQCKLQQLTYQQVDLIHLRLIVLGNGNLKKFLIHC